MSPTAARKRGQKPRVRSSGARLSRPTKVHFPALELVNYMRDSQLNIEFQALPNRYPDMDLESGTAP